MRNLKRLLTSQQEARVQSRSSLMEVWAVLLLLMGSHWGVNKKRKIDALNKKIGELEEKLKRTKDKYKAQFKEQKEKIESKDSELLEFKRWADG